ncbi:MAG: UDP-forming cellulose synthase catalytic subunit, partial [Idiomarinaceae bacterium]|nr:UDP-forming cellulose synthase catalytic subunit [Idiomarinaceae bacterium]
MLRLYLSLVFINSESLHSHGKGFSYWFPQLKRYRMTLGNWVRLIIQALYLLLLYRPTPESPVVKPTRRKFLSRGQRLSDWLFRPNAAPNPNDSQSDHKSHWLGSLSNQLFTVLASAAFIFALTLPMSAPQQGLLLLIFWALALWLRKRPGNFATLVLIFLSLFTSTRYIYWRVTETIRWDVPLDATFGLLLLVAELYAWVILVLGYIQTAWPLQRKIATLPSNTEKWPSVDIYIPTYNEPLRVVKATLLAALDIEWPRDKLNVYLLDDGKRSEFKNYCEAIGAHYIAREANAHAKAGNLNNALEETSGEFIAIFDCDHIPTRGFLQMTMGLFLKNSRLAMLQTP